MRRSNRVPLNKQFLPGGVYDANAQFIKQQNDVNLNPKIATVAADVKPVLKPQQNVTTANQPVVEQPFEEPVEEQQQHEEEEEDFSEDVNAEPTDDGDAEMQVKMEASADDNSLDNEKRTNKNVFKKIFLKRKKSSVRLKEKKLRQNRLLRKALLPKNALMALNEVKGVVISDFIVTNATNSGFTAVVTVNDIQYEGRGHSKMSAKNDACEKALRDYVIEKMRQHPRTLRKQGAELMETSENNCENDNAGDDVPMINLASFALFKLFSVWESEGFKIPELHPGSTYISGSASNAGSDVANVTKEPSKPTIRNELPNGWENMHPATLLCLMRPGLTYHDTITVGETTKLQSVYVVVDDIRFDGVGRSKKIARRNAAAIACNQMFGTNFSPLE